MSEKIIIGKTKRQPCFEGRILFPDAYTVLCLLNHHCVGGSKKDLAAIDHRINAHLYNVEIRVEVDGEVKELWEQPAIFIGEPNFIPIEAVTDIIVSNSIDNNDPNKECLDDFAVENGSAEKLSWPVIDITFSYTEVR